MNKCMNSLDKLYNKVKDETNEILLDVVISLFTSVIIYFVFAEKSELTIMQIFIGSYILRTAHNLVYIMLLVLFNIRK